MFDTEGSDKIDTHKQYPSTPPLIWEFQANGYENKGQAGAVCLSVCQLVCGCVVSVSVSPDVHANGTESASHLAGSLQNSSPVILRPPEPTKAPG
jgi:ubiquitin-protein ligase